MALPTLDARWEADTLNAAAEASAVSAWADQVAALSFAQATATKQPTLRKAVLNGKSVVRFDGGDALQATLANGRATSWTRAVVVKVPNLGAAPMVITGGDRLFPEGMYTQRGGYGSAPKWQVGVSSTNITATSTTDLDDAFHVLTVSWNATTQTATLYKDGTADGSGVNADGIDRASSVLVLGADGAGGTNDFGILDIAAVFQANRILTASERADLHSYVQDTYALTVSDYVPSGATNYNGAAASSATASLVTAGAVGKVAAAALAAAVAITAGGVVDAATTGTATRPATANVTAAGTVGKSAGTALTATASLTAAGALALATGANVSGVAAITSAGTVGTAGNGTAAVSAVGTVTSAGVVGRTAGATRTATATITAAGTVTAGTGSTAAVLSSAAITAAGTVAGARDAAIAATVTIAASGVVFVPGQGGWRDITVTGSLEARRWTGALPARNRTATLDDRRWEGDLT